MDLEIIFCDQHLLVVNKAAGISTQLHDYHDSLEAQCKIWVKQKFLKPGNVFLEAVHRLDRSVSGLVLFARNSKALKRLQEAQREGLFTKCYLAVIEGEIGNGGILEHYLRHGSHKAILCSSEERGAKFCRLKYRALKKVERYTLLEILLETGRYHQIRAQLSALGYPIVGDQKYGSYAKSHLLLHHYRFQITHPVTNRQMHWVAPYPSYWPSHFTDSP